MNSTPIVEKTVFTSEGIIYTLQDLYRRKSNEKIFQYLQEKNNTELCLHNVLFRVSSR